MFEDEENETKKGVATSTARRYRGDMDGYTFSLYYFK